MSEKPWCAHCDKPGHEEKTCFLKHGRSNVGKAANSACGGAKVARNCPVCNIVKDRKHDIGLLQRFPKFLNMSLVDRAHQIENAGGRIMCLD